MVASAVWSPRWFSFVFRLPAPRETDRLASAWLTGRDRLFPMIRPPAHGKKCCTIAKTGESIAVASASSLSL
jgi:hypothetical protein